MDRRGFLTTAMAALGWRTAPKPLKALTPVVPLYQPSYLQIDEAYWQYIKCIESIQQRQLGLADLQTLQKLKDFA